MWSESQEMFSRILLCKHLRLSESFGESLQPASYSNVAQAKNLLGHICCLPNGILFYAIYLEMVKQDKCRLITLVHQENYSSATIYSPSYNNKPVFFVFFIEHKIYFEVYPSCSFPYNEIKCRLGLLILINVQKCDMFCGRRKDFALVVIPSICVRLFFQLMNDKNNYSQSESIRL